MGDSIENPFGTLPTISPAFKGKVGPVGIGVAVGLGILLLIVLFCLLRRACKCKCKCCKRKKPTLTQRVLKKVGLQKSPQPFSISGMLDKK
ncbi:hypothetical protein AAFF_G00345880 [Aldrovandia affinis]|uniref:Uncharacterized protein n=1 Tax=Aldrovandia affinis TaxID=143900 RepID=A0AAD7SJY0_9TELE|nr:hypothetical protein AAFF_G00345880 [Aldrovandia affinis]